MDYSHLAFILLAVSIISLWFERLKAYWGLFLIVSVLLAGIAGIITPWGLIPIGLFIISGLLFRDLAPDYKGGMRSLLILQGYVVATLLSLALALHIVPGYSPMVFFADRQISPDALTYTMRWNYDKAIAGLCLVRYFSNVELKQKAADALYLTAAVVILTTVSVLSFAYLMGLIRLDVKWPDFFLVWAFSNLFITCIAEEAFFRGFIQASLFAQLSRYRFGAIISLVIASVLFGVAHISGGSEYAFVSGLAGIGYGVAYWATGRLEASIVTHFLVNAVHFILFTYPMLAVSGW